MQNSSIACTPILKVYAKAKFAVAGKELENREIELIVYKVKKYDIEEWWRIEGQEKVEIEKTAALNEINKRERKIKDSERFKIDKISYERVKETITELIKRVLSMYLSAKLKNEISNEIRELVPYLQKPLVSYSLNISGEKFSVDVQIRLERLDITIERLVEQKSSN